MLVPLANSLHPSVLSESHLINKNPVIERGLSYITRHPFYLYDSEAIQELKTRNQGLGNCESRMMGEDQIYRRNIFFIPGMAKYLFLMNHNIAEPKERRILKEQTLPQSWGSDRTGEGMAADSGWGGSYWSQLVNRQQGSKPQEGNLPPDEMLPVGEPLAGSWAPVGI